MVASRLRNTSLNGFYARAMTGCLGERRVARDDRRIKPSVDRAKPAICRHFKTGHSGERDRGRVSSIARCLQTASPCGLSFASSVARTSAHAHDAAGDRVEP